MICRSAVLLGMLGFVGKQEKRGFLTMAVGEERTQPLFRLKMMKHTSKAKSFMWFSMVNQTPFNP